MKMFLLNLVRITGFIVFVDAAKILTVVPTPSISHQVVFRPLTQELARRGHEVTVITADPAFPKGQAPENLTEIDLHDFSYKVWREIMYSVQTSGNSDDTFELVKRMFPVLSKIFEMQMLTEDVKSVINNNTNQFDLLILESCVIPALGLSHLFKVPVISMSSLGGFMGLYDLVGAPSRPPLLYPTPFRQKLNNLSLWDKISELRNHYRFESIVTSTIENDNKLIRKLFGSDVPPLEELNKNIDLLFLNVHPIWEFNRPMPPNAVYIGGMHIKPAKELPKDLKSYLDSSKNGVIYISYGTNVDPTLLPPERIQTLIQAFSELPYDVLWKWNKDELPNRSQNIKISKWLPQSDLLKHPKIKLFITQGGLQSTDEAITAGVPLIGMPMLGDQWYNVEMYVYHKIGVRLDLVDVTKENFKHAINTVINDDSYRKNIEKLRTIMRDEPQTSLERAVWWTEHLLRHGNADHLKARTANMTWSEYLDAELLIVLGVGALLILIATTFAAHLLYTYLRNIFSTGNKLKQS